jgi:hypothetical protein
MNTFSKVSGEWMVRTVNCGVAIQPGAVIPVTLRNGSTKQVTVGASIVIGEHRLYSTQRPAAQPTETVGDLSGIVALFDRARQHLRFPAIVLDGFRVNVAGGRAREPGSLTVTSVDRTQYSTRFGGGEQRQYFGRVTRAGIFEPARGAPEGLGAKLRQFACDPAGEAARYGRLHGVCCFCNKPLRDERSTSVGYGPVCADHFGLPWGATVAAPVAAQAPVAVAAARREADARARSIASEEAMEQGAA